jgi:2-polyprenyl-6-methoxyphenol hydroxylase-like FAD-dependent oxidoreductase
MRILIAGGGPVGLAAAVELRRRGFAPRIVDPDPAPSPESRALAINARTLELLEPSGATDALLAAGHRIHRLLIRVEARPLAVIEVTRLKHRFNFLLSLPQSETERILAGTLARHGGRLERNLALASFAAADGRVTATLSDGTTMEADVLVGADGARSLVRKSLGLPFDGESEPQVFSLADVELDDWPFPWDTAVVTLRPDHVVGFIPMRPGFARLVSPRPDVLQVAPAEARIRRVVWQTEFRINYRQVKSYQAGPVFLAGDAAHIHSPVGGRGMNLGIEDACWLAWLVEQSRTAEYTALRHPVAAKVLRSTARPTNMIARQTFTARLLREWLFPPLIGNGAVQRWFLPGMMGLKSPSPPWLAQRSR